MDQSENRLVHGKIPVVLLQFAIPFIAASFLQSVYGAVDLMVVGQFTGSTAVSGISVGTQLMMLATFFIQGISMGGTVLIGQRVGEANWDGAAKAVGNLSILFLAFALGLTPVMLGANHFLVSVMQTPTEAVVEAQRYLFICSAGLPFISGFNVICGIYRGMGDSKTPVYFIAIACGINIVLDFLLVGFFKLGVVGASAATVIAQACSCVCGLIHIKKKGLVFPLSKKDFRVVSSDIRLILKVGIPLAMQECLIRISFLIIVAIINTLGLVASAAVGIVEKFIGFAFIPPGCFSSAVATMVAQNVGAGQKKRAITSMKYGICFSLICGILILSVFQLFPHQLIGIFSKDQAVILAGTQYLRSYSIDCVLVCFVFCMNAYFNGNGQSLICFVHSVAATFLIRIPVSWYMSKIGQGSLGPIGLAAPMASVFSIMICVVYFIWMERRQRQVRT